MTSNENENQKIYAVIKIVDFPSRNEILDFFKSYMKELTVDNEYEIKNKSNEILLIIPNHEIALKFLETLNKEISNNLLYTNCNCSMSFKTLPPPSLALPKIKSRYKIVTSKKLYKSRSVKKLNPVKKYNTNNSCINIRSYEQKHWADIKSKAGVINSNNPYLDNHIIEYKEKMESKKKWIDQKGFNSNVGKASINRVNFIKNYVRITPSLPPLLYKFRQPDKNKWINQSGFNLY